MSNTVGSNGIQTPTTRNRLIVGIGSPHGDDRAGWTAIEQLRARGIPDDELRQAKVPHDLVDWLDDCTDLHIIDGCTKEFGDSVVRRLEWLDDSIRTGVNLRSAGSHQIDIICVLELVACLNRLPARVVLWAIPGSRFGPTEAMTFACTAAVEDCVDRMMKELNNA